jgi:hypothetical protein
LRGTEAAWKDGGFWHRAEILLKDRGHHRFCAFRRPIPLVRDEGFANPGR